MAKFTPFHGKMRILILFTVISAAIAFPRGSNLDFFEPSGAIPEECVTCIKVNDPQHQVLQFLIDSILTNIMANCETELEPPNFNTCKKGSSKYCKAAVQVLGEFWFKLPNVNNCCNTEGVRTFVKSCA